MSYFNFFLANPDTLLCCITAVSVDMNVLPSAHFIYHCINPCSQLDTCIRIAPHTYPHTGCLPLIAALISAKETTSVTIPSIPFPLQEMKEWVICTYWETNAETLSSFFLWRFELLPNITDTRVSMGHRTLFAGAREVLCPSQWGGWLQSWNALYGSLISL